MKKFLIIYTILFSLPFLLPTFVWRAVVGYAQQNWHTYDTTNSGIISNYIETIKIAQNGNIWLGTYNGVSEYINDTTWINHISCPGIDCTTLIHNDVKAIEIDNDNNIWFGTYGGITKLEPDNNWTNYTTADGLIDNDVRTIAIDDYENLWFGTANGVSLFDGDTWTSFTKPLPDTIPIPDSLSIGDTIFFDDTYIIADSSIIADTVYIYEPPGLINHSINAITIDDSGNIWFATDAGISKFTPDSNWFNYTICDSTNLFYNKVNAIAIDSNGNFWFGSHYLGLFKFDGTNWTQYSKPDSADSIATLSDNTIYSLFIDNSNNLWLGTAGGGVCKFDIATETWTNYTTNDSLAYHWIKAIAQDNNGNMWFGTWSGGVSVLTAVADIKEISQTENFINIYPNPNNGVFNIKVKSQKSKVKNIQMFNIYGKNILKSEIHQVIRADVQSDDWANPKSEIKIDLSAYANGCYFVQVITDTEIITKKVIIE